jgi:hypothetical protein
VTVARAAQYFFRPPASDWILIRSRTHAGANGTGLTMANLSDRKGAFAEALQAMTFERRRLRHPEPSTAQIKSWRPRSRWRAFPESSRPRCRADLGKPPSNTPVPLVRVTPGARPRSREFGRFQN